MVWEPRILENRVAGEVEGSLLLLDVAKVRVPVRWVRLA